MVVMVLVTLVLSGAVSLLLAQRATMNQTRRELVREATGLAAGVQQESSTRKDPAAALRNLLITLKRSLRLDGFAVVGVRPNGQVIGVAPLRPDPGLPGGITANDLSPPMLYQLRTVSGRAGGLVFAAVPFRAPVQLPGGERQLVQAVILTSRPPAALATAGPWFGLSALVILALAALVAWRLGQRFTAPIHAVQEVTARIAAGDLDARVPAPPGADPELDALAASVNSMTEGLGRAQAAERLFLQSVSHDLRTPLTSIRGFAEAIEDGATADAVAAAGVIASEARRLERLVGDLLALATVEARRFTLQMGPVDLDVSLPATVAGFAPAAAELGLALQMEPTGSGCVVMADPDRLAQVTANLVENALRYATHIVRVGARRSGDRVEIRVGDDGPGIAPEVLPRVFDRLFVARSRPDRPIGSGLGLSIVSGLVTAMGGDVRAESPLGPAGGTAMVVSLPAAKPFPAPDHTNGSVGNVAPRTGSGSDPSTRSNTVA